MPVETVARPLQKIPEKEPERRQLHYDILEDVENNDFPRSTKPLDAEKLESVTRKLWEQPEDDIDVDDLHRAAWI